METIDSHDEIVTLSEKVDLLLSTIKHRDGRRFTYEDICQSKGIAPSTISKIRTGDNLNPNFITIMALADAFGVRLGFFSTPMTRSEAERYLLDQDNTKFLDTLRLRHLVDSNSERDQKVEQIALRASLLDDEGLNTVADMLDYVLKQRGTLLTTEDSAVSDDE